MRNINILETLKDIFIKTDDVSSTDLSTEDQISEINNISNESEDTKKALGDSLQNIKMEYVIKTSELQVRHSIANEEKIKKVKLNSVKNIANAQEKIKNMDEVDEKDR